MTWSPSLCNPRLPAIDPALKREPVGGQCSCYACIPSKTLSRPGEAVDEARTAPSGGAGRLCRSGPRFGAGVARLHGLRLRSRRPGVVARGLRNRPQLRPRPARGSCANWATRSARPWRPAAPACTRGADLEGHPSRRSLRGELAGRKRARAERLLVATGRRPRGRRSRPGDGPHWIRGARRSRRRPNACHRRRVGDRRRDGRLAAPTSAIASPGSPRPTSSDTPALWTTPRFRASSSPILRRPRSANRTGQSRPRSPCRPSLRSGLTPAPGTKAPFSSPSSPTGEVLTGADELGREAGE
jgi:hypothetical protein